MKKVLLAAGMFMMVHSTAYAESAKSTDALNVVEACSRLYAAGQHFLAHKITNDTEDLFDNVPGVQILVAIIENSSSRTGLSASDCITYDGPSGVMAALSGKSSLSDLIAPKAVIHDALKQMQNMNCEWTAEDGTTGKGKYGEMPESARLHSCRSAEQNSK